MEDWLTSKSFRTRSISKTSQIWWAIFPGKLGNFQAESTLLVFAFARPTVG
jgi:hypothetical protein